MSLLQRVFVEKRRYILPVAVALAANLAFYLVAVYPLSRKVAAAEQRARAATQNLRVARARLDQTRATVTGKARADQELQRFYRDILPADLTGARRITYLRLAQLAQQSNLRYERRTIARPEAAEEDSSLTKLRMTMVLAGAYPDVRRFIYKLETAPEFVVIEDVALVQGEETSAPLVLTLQMATYFRTGGEQGRGVDNGF